jgi:hypothetical protein
MLNNPSSTTPHIPSAPSGDHDGAKSALVWLALLTIALLILPLGTLHAQDGTAAAAEPVVIGDLMWSPRSNGEDLVWEAADSYCAALELGGHDDWRLPTLAELETLHDPENTDGGQIVSPLQLDGCCLWSRTSLAELSAEEVGLPGGQSNPAERYYWGLLFAGGVRYYSVQIFPDGQALCVRDYQ